jgi:uncharacterized protein YbcV (DUF1398 family)
MTYFKALRRRVISGENYYLLNVLVRVVLGQSENPILAGCVKH